ncbi:MAG TPA: SIS domain-containing protein [Solirubrobacteraceae bacterium]|nr:SIS domain-containing protein [Solirubrobacteraceae bacterium]
MGVHGTIPTICGAGITQPIAYRWKTQINENAKSPAYALELPELDHNEIVGWGSAAAIGASPRSPAQGARSATSLVTSRAIPTALRARRICSAATRSGSVTGSRSFRFILPTFPPTRRANQTAVSRRARART